MSASDSDPPEVFDELGESLEHAARSGDLNQLDAVLSEWQALIGPKKIHPGVLQSCLYKAIEANKIAAVSLLLERGAEVNRIASDVARRAKAPPDMYQAFLDHGWNINSRGVTGRPYFQLLLDNEPVLRFFVENGADPNLRDSRRNNTALDYAAMKEPIAKIRFLLELGASIACANPLHLAAGSSDRQEAMTFFLDAGVDINAISTFGSRFLKFSGDADGPPLHRAIQSDIEENITFLLDRGADPEVKNEYNETALEYAKHWGYATAIRILEARAAVRQDIALEHEMNESSDTLKGVGVTDESAGALDGEGDLLKHKTPDLSI